MNAEELALRYLELKKAAELLEQQMKDVRRQLSDSLVDMVTNPGETFETDHVSVLMVKGRETKKLDRLELVKLGVSAAVLDAGTKVTQGQPYLKVTVAGKKEAENGS